MDGAPELVCPAPAGMSPRSCGGACTGKEIMPLRFRLKNLSEEDARAALQRERSLLYVAASRARDALVITTVGERSELLPEG